MEELLNILYLVYAAVAGLLVGSFLNVCICRIPLKETVIRGRSICRSCRRQIAWYDNIPILSYLILGGRCRHCGAPISLRYPFVELSASLLWVLAYLQYGVSVHTVLLCLLFSALLVGSFLDLDTRTIPDGLSVFISLLGAAAIFLDAAQGLSLWERFAGALAISVPMLILACLTGGFGGADIKLTAAAGLLLGWKLMLAASLLSLAAAGIFSVILLLSRKGGRRTEIPFVPFLAFGIAVSALYGGQLLQWYLSLFI